MKGLFRAIREHKAHKSRRQQAAFQRLMATVDRESRPPQKDIIDTSEVDLRQRDIDAAELIAYNAFMSARELYKTEWERLKKDP